MGLSSCVTMKSSSSVVMFRVAVVRDDDDVKDVQIDDSRCSHEGLGKSSSDGRFRDDELTEFLCRVAQSWGPRGQPDDVSHLWGYPWDITVSVIIIAGLGLGHFLGDQLQRKLCRIMGIYLIIV